MKTDKELQRTFLRAIQKEIDAMSLTDGLDLQVILIDGSRCPVNHATHIFWNENAIPNVVRKKQRKDQRLTEMLKSFYS